MAASAVDGLNEITLQLMRKGIDSLVAGRFFRLQEFDLRGIP